MKKFLLSLAAVIGLGMTATAATIEASQMTVPGTTTAGEYSITIDKAEGKTVPAYNEKTTAVRAYANNTITVTGPSITKVIFTLASDASYRYTTVAASTGTVAAQAEGDTEVVWEGNATSVTFTVGEYATLGTDGADKAGQLRFRSITINEAGSTTVDPVDPVEPGVEGEVTIASPFSGFTQLPGENVVGGYTFNFLTNSGSTKPQVYNGNLRLYAQNSMTISGVKITKVVFTFTQDNSFRYTTFAPSTGAYTTAQAEGDTQLTWEGEATHVTFTVGEKATLGSDGAEKAGQIRLASITVYGEGGAVVPPAPQGDKYEKATTLESGEYVFLCNGLLATPAAESNTYGRMSLVDATFDGDYLVTVAKNEFTLEVADGKVTIKDTYGRYYGMDAEHLTSFQFYTELNEGCYYTYEFVGENIKLTNVLNPTCIVSQTKGNQGTWYTNVAPAAAPAEYNLPILYKKALSGIFEVVEDENAPVVYYDLRGVQVENPSTGLYIRRQGNKVTKVLVK